jgi:anti-anti-sigma regulatory factor
MEFKIDTKPNFTHITPADTTIDAALAEALAIKCNELTETGSKNFLIDLKNCTDADTKSLEEFVKLHEQCYEQEQSLVFTGVNTDVLGKMQEKEIDLVINVAPTEIEAIDIINMEILERDLFGEEE